MRCFVDTAGNCLVKCFSATCDNHAPACIGRLAEPAGDAWDAGAVHVNSRYIDIDACLEMQQAVNVWLDTERKDVNTLSVRSPMGSGKSTMLDALLERVGEDKTVLVVTYRQSLALEHKRKLARKGFVSYLDADVTPQDLRRRDKTPRVICQIESLHRLAEHTCMRYLTSGFDIVVLDEVESLLRHFMSPTVVNPFAEIQGLADTLNATTTGVVTMDATWGSVTKEFLKQAGLRNLLVVNDYRSTENARTFAISKDEVTWSAQIRDDIIAGRNVVVVSLSQERAMQVHKAALDTFDDPKDAARLCLLHTSKTADAVKAKLIDVDALWSSKRIVVYTPTISAGIDFSTQHFDRMYLYLCPGSAAPMGALQVTGRVRHLVDTDVRTLVAKTMRVARDATRQHLTHVNLYQWLRWMEGFATCLEVKHVPAIDGGDDHTLQELSGGALALLFATVAPPTLKMTVESYFLAEIYNASFDYVSCFADLLEHAGHRVDLGTSYAAVSAARVHAPAEGNVEATSEFLLRVLKAQEQLDALTGAVPVAVAAPDNVPVAAPVPVAATDILSDVPSAMRRKDLMDAIEQRVMANDASEDDKFLLYLSRYCSAWGIDRVDEEFLLENKPGAVGSPKARLLSRLLCPILRPVQEELGLNQQDVFGGSFFQGVPRVQAALLDDLRQLNNVSNSRLSAAVKSAYDSAVSASNQTYGIGSLDSNGDILLGGNLRISETANIYKGAAQDHSAYVRNGELFVYGRNNYGQLGLGHTSNTITVPTKVPGINNASLVACGEGFTLCIRTDGTAISTGLNDNGQLGIGSDANGQLGRGASSANVVINSNIVPMLMPEGSNVPARSISAGGYHSAVLLNNGSAYLCGKNDQGQCGASTTLVPQANSLGIIPSLSNVVDVACGHEHTLFTCYDGQVLGVGRNDRGQLGQGNKTSPVTLVVQALEGGGAGSKNGLSVEIAAGFNHSALIKNDSTIFVFGANDKGQLGLGETTTESLTPTQLVGYAGYDIACGWNHTVISTTPDPLVFNFTGNNALIAFGDNAYGQIAAGISHAASIDGSETVSNLFVNFIGQHRCFVDALSPARLRDHEGLVVVTDKNAYASGLLRGRQRAMTINQALPVVSLSKFPKDPRAFGVISLTQDHPAGPSAAISGTELLRIAEQGDVRVQINSIGEGCIWVCDETGSTIHAGDYVTTSSLSGYASLQVLDDGDVPDGTLRNYTVAKLTMDCDFSQPLVDVEEVQKDEYGNVFFDADGSLVYTIVTTTQGPSVVDPVTGETRTGEPLETPIPVTEPAYEMRWMTTEIDASSDVSITTLISKEDYEKFRSSMQEEE
eukprot:gene31957-biopygen9484